MKKVINSQSLFQAQQTTLSLPAFHSYKETLMSTDLRLLMGNPYESFKMLPQIRKKVWARGADIVDTLELGLRV